MRQPRFDNPRARLVYHVQELERLEEVKQAAAEACREALAIAKAEGFDGTTLKVVLKLRKLTPAQRKERRALEAIYLAALGMLEGDPLPDEARRRLDEEEHPPSADQRGPQLPPEPHITEEPRQPTPAPQPPLVFKDPEEARQEGRAAAAAGKRIYDNPFPAGDPCRAAWDEGWCEQKKSHGMETPAAYQRRTKAPDKSAERSDKDAGDGKGEAA